jgi:fructose-1,6-bisphosphatase I
VVAKAVPLEESLTIAVNILTIERHIAKTQRRFPEARGNFSALMNNIAFAAKIISSHVNRAGLVNILGETGEENVQGERVQKLDVYANETIIRIVGAGGQVCAMGSEENETMIPVEDIHEGGRYVLLFDPLDGSSNIDVNVSIGTIFSILRRVSPDSGPAEERDLLQPGFRQVAAGYIIYGSSTMFVYTAGMGVHGFTLDPSCGEFLLSHENIRIPTTAKVYSVNEGYARYWDDASRRVVDAFRMGNEERAPLSSRYIGSLVADFHRNLLTGGVFFYPAVSKSENAPLRPKLRLLYEAAPLAYIVDQAGGHASDGVGPILRRQPRSLHERVPLIIGSRDDVHYAEKLLHQSTAKPASDHSLG